MAQLENLGDPCFRLIVRSHIPVETIVLAREGLQGGQKMKTILPMLVTYLLLKCTVDGPR